MAEAKSIGWPTRYGSRSAVCSMSARSRGDRSHTTEAAMATTQTPQTQAASPRQTVSAERVLRPIPAPKRWSWPPMQNGPTLVTSGGAAVLLATGTNGRATSSTRTHPTDPLTCGRASRIRCPQGGPRTPTKMHSRFSSRASWASRSYHCEVHEMSPSRQSTRVNLLLETLAGKPAEPVAVTPLEPANPATISHDAAFCLGGALK